MYLCKFLEFFEQARRQPQEKIEFQENIKFLNFNYFEAFLVKFLKRFVG